MGVGSFYPSFPMPQDIPITLSRMNSIPVSFSLAAPGIEGGARGVGGGEERGRTLSCIDRCRLVHPARDWVPFFVVFVFSYQSLFPPHAHLYVHLTTKKKYRAARLSRPSLPHVSQRRHQGTGRRGRAHRIGTTSIQARGQQERTSHGPTSQAILRELPGSQEEEDCAGQIPR